MEGPPGRRQRCLTSTCFGCAVALLMQGHVTKPCWHPHEPLSPCMPLPHYLFPLRRGESRSRDAENYSESHQNLWGPQVSFGGGSPKTPHTARLSCPCPHYSGKLGHWSPISMDSRVSMQAVWRAADSHILHSADIPPAQPPKSMSSVHVWGTNHGLSSSATVLGTDTGHCPQGLPKPKPKLQVCWEALRTLPEVPPCVSLSWGQTLIAHGQGCLPGSPTQGFC